MTADEQKRLTNITNALPTMSDQDFLARWDQADRAGEGDFNFFLRTTLEGEGQRRFGLGKHLEALEAYRSGNATSGSPTMEAGQFVATLRKDSKHAHQTEPDAWFPIAFEHRYDDYCIVGNDNVYRFRDVVIGAVQPNGKVRPLQDD